MRIRLAVTATVLTTAASVGGGIATATPSFATPSGCGNIYSYSVPGYNGYHCTGGTGYYRAWVRCTAVPGDSFYRQFYGPWVGADHTNRISWAECTAAYPYLAQYGGEGK